MFHLNDNVSHPHAIINGDNETSQDIGQLACLVIYLMAALSLGCRSFIFFSDFFYVLSHIFLFIFFGFFRNLKGRVKSKLNLRFSNYLVENIRDQGFYLRRLGIEDFLSGKIWWIRDGGKIRIWLRDFK